MAVTHKADHNHRHVPERLFSMSIGVEHFHSGGFYVYNAAVEDNIDVPFTGTGKTRTLGTVANKGSMESLENPFYWENFDPGDTTAGAWIMCYCTDGVLQLIVRKALDPVANPTSNSDAYADDDTYVAAKQKSDLIGVNARAGLGPTNDEDTEGQPKNVVLRLSAARWALPASSTDDLDEVTANRSSSEKGITSYKGVQS